MKRIEIIESIIIEFYGGIPRDDFDMPYELVNVWMNEGIGLAAAQSYMDNYKIDGISYVDDSFKTTFKEVPITKDTSRGEYIYKAELPEIPLGIGAAQNITNFRLRSTDGWVSVSLIPITTLQAERVDNMRPIFGRVQFWQEGKELFFQTTLPLNEYTGNVTIISGTGDDLESEFNVPANYMPVIRDYINERLALMKQIPKDLTHDGVDIPK